MLISLADVGLHQNQNQLNYVGWMEELEVSETETDTQHDEVNEL